MAKKNGVFSVRFFNGIDGGLPTRRFGIIERKSFCIGYDYVVYYFNFDRFVHENR